MACHECGELQSPRLSPASRRDPLMCYAICWTTALATLGWSSNQSSDRAVLIALWCWASNSFSPVHLPLSHGSSVSSIEEVISPAFSLRSVSSEMVSWKGHRPESRVGWRASGLAPDALTASYIRPPGLSFLTSAMGVMLLPHGVSGRVRGDWKSQHSGHSKGRVALGEAHLLWPQASHLLGRQQRDPSHSASCRNFQLGLGSL